MNVQNHQDNNIQPTKTPTINQRDKQKDKVLDINDIMEVIQATQYQFRQQGNTLLGIINYTTTTKGNTKLSNLF